MTLLTIVQDATDLIGIPRPSTVAGAPDPRVRRLLALSNIGGKVLAARHNWTSLIREATHTTLAQEDQGAVTTIAAGFHWLVNQTLWDRTGQDLVDGPLSPQQWQADKSSLSSGPYSQFRIRGGKLLMIPAPTAGKTLAFEYGTRYWCQSSGGTDQVKWAADTDVGVLDEHLLTLDLYWRFLQATGLAYGEAFASFEREANLAMARDGGSPVLSLDGGGDGGPIPDIRVPDGNWSL